MSATEVRAICPFCDSLTGSGKVNPKFYINLEKGLYSCKHCGASGKTDTLDEDKIQVVKEVEAPKEFNKEVLASLTPLTERAKEYLAKRLPGLDANVDGILYSEDRDALAIITRDFDGNVIGIKYRSLEDSDTLRWMSEPGSRIGEFVLQGSKNKLLVVEGQFDAITAKLSGFTGTVLAIETTSVKKSVLQKIQEFTNVFLMLDNDEAGQEAVNKIKQDLYGRAQVVKLPEGVKDLNELLQTKGLDETKDFLKANTSTEVERLTISIVDRLDGIVGSLSDTKWIKGDSTGWPVLDIVLGCGLRVNEFTVVNSFAKNGKSTFVNNIIFNLLKSGKKVGLASFEMEPDKEIYYSLLSMAGKKDLLDIPSDKIEAEVARIIGDNLFLKNLLIYNRIGKTTWEKVRDWSESVIANHNVDYLILDHSGFMLKDMKDSSENNDLASNLRKLAADNPVHVMCVVQAPKPGLGRDGRYTRDLGLETTYGGMGWGMYCNNFISIKIDEENKNQLHVRLVASRFRRALTGEEVLLYYDRETGLLAERFE